MMNSIVVLTGAGISAESGLATFRGVDGLWENERIEDVVTPEGFARDRVRVHRFYNERRRKLKAVYPNKAHQALAEFEARYAGNFLLITQNIDDLHERAGSKRLCHMHGELLKAYCLSCQQSSNIMDDLSITSVCPLCSVRGQMRPDIIWFGEMPYHMSVIEEALSCCSLFISIGTSGTVYPAAGFVRLAKQAGAYCVEINLEAMTDVSVFDEQITGKATMEVPNFLSRQMAFQKT